MWTTRNTDFYPRPPRGGRLRHVQLPSDYSPISTHALREEGDLDEVALMPRSFVISTHALREEGDFPTDSTYTTRTNFYPRPPRGGRLRVRDTKCYQ